MDCSEMFPVFDGHMMPIYGDEPHSCGFGCTYCLARTKGYEQDADQLNPGAPSEAERRIKSTIAGFGDAVRCISSSRFHELFARDQEEGIRHIQRISQFGLSVSLLTKAALTDKTLDELQEIDSHLQEQGRRLVTEISFATGRDRPDLYPILYLKK